MSDFITSGRILDVVIAMTLLEGLALVIYRHVTGRGLRGTDVIGLLAAGACLALAFRLFTLGAGWIWIALCLTGALLAHLADLARRWPRTKM